MNTQQDELLEDRLEESNSLYLRIISAVLLLLLAVGCYAADRYFFPKPDHACFKTCPCHLKHR